MLINNIKYFVALLLLLVFASCFKTTLDLDNPAAITGSDVWNDASLVQTYVSNIYNDRPGWDYNLYNNITDEARNNYPGTASDKVLIGQWDSNADPMDIWGNTQVGFFDSYGYPNLNAYSSIRKMNEFFMQIKTSKIADSVKISFSGEVYFLRAFMYFDLVKRYGGVPIVTEAQQLTDDLQVPRASLDDTYKFILQDLDNAIAALPADAPKGKATKGAAMALKGRVLLYYASPLYNTGNDQSRWSRAAEANKAVLDMNKYQLYDDLSTLWLNPANNESIFEVEYHLPEKYHGWDALVKPLVIANGDSGQCLPLQDLISAFPMAATGKLITDPTSGYDPNNPYVGRDKRFSWFIGYNGSTLKGSNETITLQIYKGGRDYDADPATAQFNTITGYYCVKATDPNNKLYQYHYGSVQPWIEIRYTEVLLNYAEAQNEALGSPDASVYSALNAIRTRAGIKTPLIVGSYSKLQMRELIRNERYIELCFEGKRYWDLRRWKIATSVLNGKKGTGVVITKAGSTFTYQYIPIDVQNNVFTEKMYFLPVPFPEITKNKNLVQNQGW